MTPPADLFHALSSEVRLLILRLLAAQDGTLSVEVLTDRMNAEGWHLQMRHKPTADTIATMCVWGGLDANSFHRRKEQEVQP